MFGRRIALALGVVTLSIGCGGSRIRTAPTDAVGSIHSARPSVSCFLLFQIGVGEVRRAPASGCAARVSPESTFKIPHALAALDSGVIEGPDTVLPYDGSPMTFPAWRRDHTLASAMRYSVVWYFQRIADLLGPAREREYLTRFGYGNEDASLPQRRFWLDGSLLISPDEQEHFLVRLYEDEGKLPVSEAAIHAVRESLVQPPGVIVNAAGEHRFANPWPVDAVVSAKTGSGTGARSGDVRWLVGHVRRGLQSWVFVSCVTGGRELDPLAAVSLAAKSLHAEQVL